MPQSAEWAMGNRQRTERVVARNLVMLAERAGLDLQAVAIKAGVGIRTMHHIKSGRNTTIDTVDALGRVFGLTGWHLLNPNLEADLANQDWLDRVRAVFGTAPEQGVELLKNAVKVAETFAIAERAKTKT